MKNVSAIAALLLLGGCSLINSFDELKPQASDGGGEGGKSSTGGGKGTGGSSTGGGKGTGGASVEAGAGGSNDASTGGEPNTGGGSGTGGTGSGGAPDEDVVVPGGPGGAIVVYQSTKSPVVSEVWVLDPATGAALSKTNSPNVAAILNDPGTDNWYWFETTGPLAATATLYVRELSLPGGRWRDVGPGVTVPAPVGTVGLLNGGIAYLSGSQVDPTARVVTVLNTSNQKSVKKFADVPLDPSAANAVLDTSDRVGIIAHTSAKGGTVTVVLQETGANCTTVGTNSICNIDLMRVSVDLSAGGSGAAADAAAVTVGKINTGGGSPGFAADTVNDADVIFLSPQDGSPIPSVSNACSVPPAATLGTAQEFKPTDHTPTTAAFSFPMGSTHISAAAYDYCQNIAYATSLLDQVIWAVPTSGSPPPPVGQICKSSGGAALLYEPYTRSLLRVANDSSLESYTVTGGAGQAPTFKTNLLHLPAGFSVTGAIAVRTGSPVNTDNPSCGP